MNKIESSPYITLIHNGLETMTKRKQHSPKFKTKVALEALKGRETTTALAQRFGLHPNQISAWKRQLLDGAEEIFTRKNTRKATQNGVQEAQLYEQIGRLKIENDYLKKKVDAFD